MTLVEKEILLERRRFAWRVFAFSASLVLLVLGIAQGLLYFAGLRLAASGHGEALLVSEQAWRTILAVSLTALLATAYKGYRAWTDSARKIGRIMDEKLAASKNRLEASSELSHASDPLAVAQRRETSDYLNSSPARQRTYTLALAAACGVTLLIVNSVIATKFIGLLQSSQALAQMKKPDLPKVATRAAYAKIDIVAPESETRATPVEEVVVKGDADSDNGFSAVSLNASINGGPNKSIPIDPATFNKGGETKFDQSLFIDELGAQPYDVIGYYLQGTSRHTTPLTVSSQIQFIEVRPFREDIHKVMLPPGGKGASSQTVLDLQALISRQIAISKRTWIIATTQLPPTDPVIVSETGKTGVQQDKIATSTHELYQTMTGDGAPASIVDHVAQAETSMHQAVDKIKKPALVEAPPLQQHALGELVEATKDIIKIMAMNNVAATSPPSPDPFKDRQKLPPSPDPASTSPLAKLNQLIKREQDVVKNLSPSTSDLNNNPESPMPDQPQKEGQTAQNESNQGQNSQPQPGSSPSSSQQNGQQQGLPQPGPQTAQNESNQGQNPQPQPASSPSSSQQNSQQQGLPQTGPQTAQNKSPGAQNSATDGNQQEAPQTGPQMAREQSQIGKALGDLQNQPDTPASSGPAMSEAQEAAQNSADKLGAEDEPGAFNDARMAEAAMLRAQTAMEAEAGQHMRDALAQAQQQLQEAAQAQLNASSPSDQAQVKDQAGAARDDMAQEQDHQAASGDPKLAQLASHLLKQYDQSGITQKQAQLASQPNSTPEDRTAAAEAMRNFADQISAERLAMQSETQNLEDTLKRIDRVDQNMNSARGTPQEQAQLAHELQSDLNTALSDAKALLPHDSQPGPDGKTPGGNGGAPGGSGSINSGYSLIKVPLRPGSPVAFQVLREPLAAFRLEIEKRLEYLRNQMVLTYLNPDESPEEYRAQVAAYYERISRETKAATPNPPEQTPSP